MSQKCKIPQFSLEILKRKAKGKKKHAVQNNRGLSRQPLSGRECILQKRLKIDSFLKV